MDMAKRCICSFCKLSNLDLLVKEYWSTLISPKVQAMEFLELPSTTTAPCQSDIIIEGPLLLESPTQPSLKMKYFVPPIFYDDTANTRRTWIAFRTINHIQFKSPPMVVGMLLGLLFATLPGPSSYCSNSYADQKTLYLGILRSEGPTQSGMLWF